MNREDLKLQLEDVMSPKRYIHSLNVMNVSMKLAKKYGEDFEKAGIAGLLHDLARDIRGEELFNMCKKHDIKIDDVSKLQPELLHGPLGAVMAREIYNITEPVILNAISCHTTGNGNMSQIDKIVFLADYIEPDRSFTGIFEVRDIAYVDMDRAIVIALEKIMKHVMSKGSLIHIDTVCARNSILQTMAKKPTTKIKK